MKYFRTVLIPCITDLFEIRQCLILIRFYDKDDLRLHIVVQL